MNLLSGFWFDLVFAALAVGSVCFLAGLLLIGTIIRMGTICSRQEDGWEGSSNATLNVPSEVRNEPSILP